MKKIRNFIIIILLLILSLIINNVYKNKSNKPVIYMIVKVVNSDYDFWELCRMGAETAAKEYNVDLILTGPKIVEDADIQIDVVKDAIAQKPDAIILAASNNKKLKSIAKEAINNEIHLITLDSGLESHPEETYVGTNNILAGKSIGEELAKLINRKGKVAVVSFFKEASTAIEREKGITLSLKKYNNIDVIDTEYCNGNIIESYNITKKLLLENKDLKGIIGTNQQSLEGIALAVEEEKANDRVAVVGFDTSIKLVKALENNIIDAFLVQKPYNMGYISVKTAVDSINNKNFEKSVNIDFEIVDKDSIYQKENEKLIFPFIK